jgi:hypothetical protein
MNTRQENYLNKNFTNQHMDDLIKNDFGKINSNNNEKYKKELINLNESMDKIND